MVRCKLAASFIFRYTLFPPAVGAADAEIKVPSVENPKLIDVLSLKPAVGQNIATHALPTARNFHVVLISIFQVYSSSFSIFQILSLPLVCAG